MEGVGDPGVAFGCNGIRVLMPLRAFCRLRSHIELALRRAQSALGCQCVIHEGFTAVKSPQLDAEQRHTLRATAYDLRSAAVSAVLLMGLTLSR